MTITKYDGVAILPKRCDKCNRLFWLEPYNIFYKTVGIEEYPLKQIECKNCIGKTDALDKIRAEIELKEKTLTDKYGQQKYGIWTDEVLQIIDKYKAESGDN